MLNASIGLQYLAGYSGIHPSGVPIWAPSLASNYLVRVKVKNTSLRYQCDTYVWQRFVVKANEVENKKRVEKNSVKKVLKKISEKKFGKKIDQELETIFTSALSVLEGQL